MAPVVDVHTHVYPPSYIDLLKSRTAVPYIRTYPDDPSNPRLIILPDEESSPDSSSARGRPLQPGIYDVAEKLRFMDDHKIDISVISLANPWLDFVAPDEASETTRMINDEIDTICGQYPGRLYAFAALPLSASVSAVVKEIDRVAALSWTRGVILGTSGLKDGLDDPALDSVYEALERTGLVSFIHPHYGLPASVYGPRSGEYGHVLPLALGFPMETTIAVTRMYLSGVWDRFSKLSVLLAHSGGTLPFLAGRIESCIQHDGHLTSKWESSRRSIWDVLKSNMYLDAVVYSRVGLKAALEASGSESILFGTDHPFFPPLANGQRSWLSVDANTKAINEVFGEDPDGVANALGGNAARILRLEKINHSE